MPSDAKAITQSVKLVKDRRLNCLCVTAENSELRRPINDMEEKTLKVGLPAKQL